MLNVALYPGQRRRHGTTRLINTGVAAIILFAAFAKIAATPNATAGLPDWTTGILIAIEVAVGLLLITGAWARFTIRLSLILFASFAGWSAVLAAQDVPACSCFGSLFHVEPIWMLVIDLGLTAWFLALVVRDTRKPRPVLGTKQETSRRLTLCKFVT